MRECKNLYELVLSEKMNLEKMIIDDQEQIAKLPEGSLHAYKRQDGYNWYVAKKDEKNDKKNARTYLPKSEKSIAQDLALKGYLKARMRENSENLRAANAYLRACNKKNYTKNYLDKNSEITNLLNSNSIWTDKYISDWLKKIYTGPRPHAEYLTVTTKAGVKVRSKSEEIIVGHLFDNDIPFKYEDCLKMRTHDIFPDFTIMNPRTYEVYIWEHFGIMDDANYRSINMRKIEDYAKLGYFLGENLIITFETKDSGIDEFLIDFYIKHYFL